MQGKKQSQALRAAHALTAVAAYLERRGPGLDNGMWALLRFIAEANPRAATAKTFATLHDVTEATAAHHVSSLLKLGHIKRLTHPEDRRANILQLTRKGRGALKRDPLLPAAQRLCERYRPEELDTVGAALQVLSNSATEWSGLECRECGGVLDRFHEASSDEATDLLSHLGRAASEKPAPTRQAFAIVRAVALMAKDINRAAASRKLATKHWTALRYFSASPVEHATTDKLAAHQGVTRQAASLVSAELREAGLLVGQKAAGHKSPTHFAPSPKAKRTLTRDPARKVAQVLESEFNKKELEIIGGAFAEILKAETSGAPSK